jgi:hypothetical protein
MLYASSCDRPSKSSARVFLPSSVSNSYSFSTGTQGRSRRLLLISSFRSPCSASSLASSSAPSSRTRRIGRYRDHEMRLAGTPKLIATVLGARHFMSEIRLPASNEASSVLGFRGWLPARVVAPKIRPGRSSAVSAGLHSQSHVPPAALLSREPRSSVASVARRWQQAKAHRSLHLRSRWTLPLRSVVL